MSNKLYFVYILGSISGTLYIGMTNNLERRIMQHKAHVVEGFTDDYDVDRLLYYEAYDDVHRAIAREKQLKGWVRAKKIALIEKLNPTWKDLAKEFAEGRGPSTRAYALAQDDTGKGLDSSREHLSIEQKD